MTTPYMRMLLETEQISLFYSLAAAASNSFTLAGFLIAPAPVPALLIEQLASDKVNHAISSQYAAWGFFVTGCVSGAIITWRRRDDHIWLLRSIAGYVWTILIPELTDPRPGSVNAWFCIVPFFVKKYSAEQVNWNGTSKANLTLLATYLLAMTLATLTLALKIKRLKSISGN